MIGKVENMISASAADAHRFGRVKRNGYDPAEVDAVVSRLVATLQTYEERTGMLEERLAEADASADAIRRTFIAAEKTRDEILDGAREHASSITDTARREAEDVVNVAREEAAEMTERAQREAAALGEVADRLDMEIAATRTQLLESAEAAADGIMAEAEAAAAERTATSTAFAQEELAAATAEGAELRRRSELAARVAATAAAWTLREALLEAERIIARADERAILVVADSERESAALIDRAEQLRSAVAALEASAASLAAMTASNASVIDLSEIEALENADVDMAVLQDPPVNTIAFDSKKHDREEVGDEDDPIAPVFGEGPRLLTVAEATAELDLTDDDRTALDLTDDHAEVDLTEDDRTALDLTDDHATEPRGDNRPAQPTYYQRTTGVPLSERVKLARKSS